MATRKNEVTSVRIYGGGWKDDEGIVRDIDTRFADFAVAKDDVATTVIARIDDLERRMRYHVTTVIVGGVSYSRADAIEVFGPGDDNRDPLYEVIETGDDLMTLIEAGLNAGLIEGDDVAELQNYGIESVRSELRFALSARRAV